MRVGPDLSLLEMPEKNGQTSRIHKLSSDGLQKIQEIKHKADVPSFQIVHWKVGLSLQLLGLSELSLPPENTSSSTLLGINETSSVYYINRNSLD